MGTLVFVWLRPDIVRGESVGTLYSFDGTAHSKGKADAGLIACGVLSVGATRPRPDGATRRALCVKQGSDERGFEIYKAESRFLGGASRQ